MKNLRQLLWSGGLAVAAVLAAVGTAEAGLIVVAGDHNITNALVGASTAEDPGNQQFFQNVLGSGTQVLVHGTDNGGVDQPIAYTNTFYGSLAGVTSTIQAGAITAASLSGVDLFVGAFPAANFSAGEIAALDAFSDAGGTIFLMADAGGFAGTRNVFLNNLLVGIGSSLRIVGADLDSGFRNAAPSQILPSVLTANIDTFTYAFASQVTGGTGLFTTTGGTVFVAAEDLSSVPEPVTALLLASGLAVAFFRRRTT